MSNPIELPSSDRGQSLQSLSDEPIFPAEDEANFIEFTVRIPKEDLSLNTVQRAIQTQFDDKGLNQFMVSVEQKAGIAPSANEDSQSDAEWKPSCLDLDGDMVGHRADGNCLCYALYEAYGKEEILVPAKDGREAISVRNLRRHIISAQVDKLKQLCVNVPRLVDDSLGRERQKVQNVIGRILDPNIQTVPKSHTQEFDRIALFQGLSNSKGNIQAAVDYIKTQNISSRNDISNKHLSKILTRLNMRKDSQFIAERLNSETSRIVELKLLSVVESPTDEDLLITLCDGLIGIARELFFASQQAPNCDRLLNVVQRIFEENPGKGNVAMLQLICAKYNNSTASREDHIILQNGFPVSWIKHLVEFAIEIVKTNRPNSYIHNDCFHDVVQMLQQPILLIYENCEWKNGKMVNGNDKGKVYNCALYALDGQLHEYSVNGEGGLIGDDRYPKFSEVFTDGMITIAMHPGHYYGIPSFSDNNLHIGNRTVAGVNREGLVFQESYGEPQDISSSSDSELPEADASTESRDVNILQSFESIRGTEIFNKLQTQLTRFQDQFIPYLQRVGKDWQINAEVENLQHIRSCAEEMLKEDGLNFKPEFVAKIVCERLRMAMFGLGQLDSVEMGSINIGDISDEGENKYQPSCMWDFGQNRTVIPLEGEGYHWDGALASPCPQEEQSPADQQNNTENRFSILRGRGEKGDYYAMPNGEITPSLGARFRQFLAFQSKISGGFSPTDDIEELLTQIPNDFESDESVEKILEKVQGLSAIDPNQVENGVVKELLSITCNDILKPLIEKVKTKLPLFHLNENTPLTDLPPSLMFLVGLQFGQNQVGSWNPFTLAVKRYFAYQFADETQSFFWPQEYQPPEEMEDVLQYSFTDLIAKIWPGREFDVAIAEQFENAIIAYYAITQEILSRSEFLGNDQGIYLGKVMRLEDMEAIKAMTFSGDGFRSAISNNAKRPVLVAGSVGAHVTSLDRANDFPPPMRIITKYEQVHHAHIFGIHLFNVDFCNATRVIRRVFDDEKSKNETLVGQYNNGCPFFKDPQRETLLIPRGLKAEICGVLASADDQNHAYVLANSSDYDSHSKEEIQLDTLEEKVKHKIQFCITSEGLEDILKDCGITKPTSWDDAEYNPSKRSKGSKKSPKKDRKYKQAQRDLQELSKVSIIAKELHLNKVYRIKGRST